MRTVIAAALLAAVAPAMAADADYVKSVQEWRARAEESLRRDNGWLTLAGRFVMKPGVNTFGTGEGNDIVFPKGLGPEKMGTITVEPNNVYVKLEPGLTMTDGSAPVTERMMSTKSENRDWVQIGRASFHVIERDGRYILRLADKESEVRKKFGGRVWYDVKASHRVDAKFVPHKQPKKIPIVNVIDEVTDVDSPGYVEFRLGKQTHRLDVVGDGDGLFFVFRDATAGETTYAPGRFLYVQEKPQPNKPFKLDLNRAYNPPCAFSEFTTCPLPPKQNILKVRIEAGEKYPPRKAG